EEERGDPFRRGVVVDARHRVLKGRRSVLAHPERLAVEHRLPNGEPTRDVDETGKRVRDVVEVPRIDPHLVVAAVDLDGDGGQVSLAGRLLETAAPLP